MGARGRLLAGTMLAGVVWAGGAGATGVPTVDAGTTVVDVIGLRPTGLIGNADTASQGTVLKEQLDLRPAYRVGELLETVPGLIVTQHSGEGKANQYFLRGFNLDHGTDIAISLDGMPVNMRTHAHGQGYADLNFMIPELVSGLQYGKGTYTAADGDFATAGTVHIGYLDSLDHDLASISAGTLGDQRAMAAASRQVAGGTLTVAGEYTHVDGPWTIPDNFHKVNGVLRYSQGNADNGWAVTAMGMSDHFHATNQIPERAVNEGMIGLYDAIDPTDGGSSSRWSVSGRYADTDGDRQIKASAYVIGYDMTLFNDFDYSIDFPSPINDQFEQKDHRHIYGGEVSYTRYANWFGLDGQNTVGFQTRVDDIDLLLARTTERVERFLVRADNVLEASGGLYLENRTQWADKLRTVAGLREDVFYGDDDSSDTLNSGTASKGLLSPKLNIIMGPWDETEFYASVGRGFHSNDVRGAVTKVDALSTVLSGAITAQNKTPLMTPATGYEVGLRTGLVPHLQASLALFVLDLDSELTFSGDAGQTSAGRPSRRQGVEVSTFYTPAPWLIIDADFALSHARFTSPDTGEADVIDGHPGDFIPGASKINASVGVTITDLGALGSWASGLEAGLQFRYFGARPLLEDGSVWSPATGLVNARVGYKLTDTITLQVDVFNLLDRHAHQIDYYYPSQLPGEAAPVNDIHFHPVEPRSARFTVSAKF
ncbi:TonB-dependent receptor [Nitrospirillum amazonense]|uniref:TonB-dependent receptor n=1 Tax=Nitrospirillum amazonense TaxID=28077 RepID=UPI002DD44253|nr:TonB-dependent receptor [Nitrospirillum amazonense]MEC4595229.1 TonB-dependent receptor [Nitrospirillum amazonense]